MKGNPNSEKLLMLINAGIDKDYISATEVKDLLHCCRRTATRQMTKLHAMSHEMRWLTVERWGEGMNRDPYLLKIRISDSYAK